MAALAPSAFQPCSEKKKTPTLNGSKRKTSEVKLQKRGVTLGGLALLIHAAYLHNQQAPALSPLEQRSPQFYELQDSGGVKALDIRPGSGDFPSPGDEVAIHYYGRLAAKQGWRFDSTYDHKDASGTPQPFVFQVGSNNVIAGLDSAVRTMRVGGVRRVVIPPSQGYQNTNQEPLPPNIFDRQRLFTTIFNPTRVANGESSTLGTLVFDVELVRITK